MLVVRVLCFRLVAWMPKERSLSGATKEKYEEIFISSYCDVYILEGTLLIGILMVPHPISKMENGFFPFYYLTMNLPIPSYLILRNLLPLHPCIEKNGVIFLSNNFSMMCMPLMVQEQ